ncbi:Signal peptidase I [Prochlorococcus sp. MIT 1307]|uniref:Signal peptidase I n=1 Tax=Prochlorococcus sp. MIT 1307 TaxID=3096219 RepID=UPI002A764518|nr:Signal peptidase I [Prochlorococcus sp. MIT 1307]
MTKEVKENKLLKKSGKWGAILGITWIGLNIVIPLVLLRIPAVQKILVVLETKLPFDIPGVG